MNDSMLTTIDNPFNPFTQFNDWYKFDMMKGYDTCGYLARLANTSDKFGDEKNMEIIKEAQKTIISIEPFLYKIVEKSEAQKIDKNG